MAWHGVFWGLFSPLFRTFCSCASFYSTHWRRREIVGGGSNKCDLGEALHHSPGHVYKNMKNQANDCMYIRQNYRVATNVYRTV
ncbi:hypothetical protein F4808DRAFT_201158 [Astrocystis sublimbata]|nr:hypothetical protein F4808DRAFT_201158 [Astrocystis sublimbata]